MEYDPWMGHSIKVTRRITEGLQPIQQHFDELKRKRQPPIIFYQKVSGKKTPLKPSTLEHPQPSVSSAPDIQLSTLS